MDVSPISHAAALAADAKRRAQGNRPEQKGEQAGIDQGGSHKRKPSKLLDLYDTGRINRNILRDQHGLNRRKAAQVLNDICGRIAQSSPWSLAELQPVAHRRLIPSAYV